MMTVVSVKRLMVVLLVVKVSAPFQKSGGGLSGGAESSPTARARVDDRAACASACGGLDVVGVGGERDLALVLDVLQSLGQCVAD
jgi:hypothetical protein